VFRTLDRSTEKTKRLSCHCKISFSYGLICRLAKHAGNCARSQNVRERRLSDDGEAISVSRIMSRGGTVFIVIALASYFLWEMFSESAALSRLSATAAIFHYTERCNADGNPIATGQPNCVDLNRYMFVHGPIDRAIRRACPGKKAGILSFEEGKVSRSEINSVQKELQFRARNGASSPC